MQGYTGKLLHKPGLNGEILEHLEKFITTCIAMEKSLLPPIPYLAAWQGDRKRIWYEYASPRLRRLLECPEGDPAECIRQKVLDRREYHYTDSIHATVEEQIISGSKLQSKRLDLRQKVIEQGRVEAIYKLSVGTGTVWLKDQAIIMKFPGDDIYLSPGCLTDVTKEMEQKELLERLGYYDELTGLPRRSIMDRIMEINVGQYCRGHIDDFCFILIDVDHFKKINDTWGHKAGDYVLSTMAGIMYSAKRKEDELGRFGGEEFFGICQGDIQTGLAFTERLRHVVNSHSFKWKGHDLEVRFSAGVASATELKNLTEEALVELADKRLYLAKSRGRNCTVIEG